MATVLRRGSRGEEVKKLQRLLAQHGFLGQNSDDGIFGYGTERATKDFQRTHGLYVDGVVGPATWAELLKGVESESNDEIKIIDGHINTHINLALGRKIKYLAIHFTAGATSRKGAALATRNVFLSRRASADYVVDDEQIVQINPDPKAYYCWAVGDNKSVGTGGASLYGIATNKNTISIEICSNLEKGSTSAVPNHDGWSFTEKALDNALRLTRYLMRMYNIPKSNVVRHYDVSGKLCPGVIGWNDAILYTMDGKPTTFKNNSEKWLAFKERI